MRTSRCGVVAKFRVAMLVTWHVLFCAAIGAAQDSTSTFTTWTRPLPTIGSPAEDRDRIQQILGTGSTGGYLVRSPSSREPLPSRKSSGLRPRIQIIPPEMQLVWNSHIPFSLNDGTLWAGRGANLQIVGGVRAGLGPVSLSLAPQLTYQQNREFDVIPYTFRERSPFQTPWHTFPESVDLPMRFGDEPFSTVDLGQSTVSLRLGQAVVGASTENQWWGPGIRNAILVSNHAPGFPHLFIRPGAPLRTPLGVLWGKWMVGRLTESDYFDYQPENDLRAISGFALTLQPAFDPDLTLGLARVVYAPLPREQSFARRAFDVFTNVGRPNARPLSDLEREPGPDQLLSLFARWVFPRDGFEVYTEWSRLEFPSTVREFLTAPYHTQGYTVGLQWAKPLRAESVLRLQTELTYLEESSTYRQQRVTSYYTSRPVLQGYTNRGQVLGASIGPGASSQWIATDYLAPRWQLGLFAGRIRWENDKYYASRGLPTLHGHDVSVFGGIRSGFRIPGAEIQMQYTGGTRFNYLFQNLSDGFQNIRAIDVRNHTLGFSIFPTGG